MQSILHTGLRRVYLVLPLCASGKVSRVARPIRWDYRTYTSKCEEQAFSGFSNVTNRRVCWRMCTVVRADRKISGDSIACSDADEANRRQRSKSSGLTFVMVLHSCGQISISGPFVLLIVIISNMRNPHSSTRATNHNTSTPKPSQSTGVENSLPRVTEVQPHEMCTRMPYITTPATQMHLRLST